MTGVALASAWARDITMVIDDLVEVLNGDRGRFHAPSVGPPPG